MLPKIFHLHIPKAAGTTVNLWLENLAHALACRPYAFNLRWGEDMAEGIAIHRDLSDPPASLPTFDITGRDDATPEDIFRKQIDHYTFSRYSWANFDVIHGHVSIHRLRPPGAFVFSLLRDPMARAVSQLIDLMSLTVGDFVRDPHGHRPALQMVLEQGFEAALAHYPDHRAFQAFFEDKQCRILLQEEIGFREFQAMTPEQRAQAAIATLDAECDFVGVQEHLVDSLTVLSSILGLCPPRSLHRSNDRPHMAHLRNFSPAVLQWMAERSRGDQILYAHALERFAAHAAAHGDYDAARFEALHAESRCAELSPVRIGRAFVFDMNMAIVGSGFHAREGQLTVDCARWTGPETDLILYFPVPADTDLHLRIYTKGWTDWSLRETLRVSVDDEVRPHRFEHPPRLAEAIVVDARSNRSWIKVTVAIAATSSDAERGIESTDRRKKGFALWGYGYEPIAG